MTTGDQYPGAGGAGGSGSGEQPVDLGKHDPAADAPFDPYRFGAPEHPVPPEYAPPGYVPPPAQPPAQNQPYGQPYGQQPYGQQPYGLTPPGWGPAPSAPSYHSYQQPPAGNGKAIAGLVLGIASIVLCWTTYLDAIFVVLALVFSSLGLSDAKRKGTGRGQATAGLVCAIIGAVLAIAFTAWLYHVAGKCGGFTNSNAPGFSHCIENHL